MYAVLSVAPAYTVLQRTPIHTKVFIRLYKRHKTEQKLFSCNLINNECLALQGTISIIAKVLAFIISNHC